MQQLFKVLILYFLPLHVSGLIRHLQEEYTIILGSYFILNESVVLCYYILFIVYVRQILPLST
jgi:hypothetical protein